MTLLAHAARTGALRPGLILIGDKGFAGRNFEDPVTTGYALRLVRPDQLDLERHGGRTTAGVYTRITQRLLAMAAAIWHNWATAESIKRSLIAYDN